ncbi:MAG: hypothetical protein COV73_01830 [Candidatus Omnitrophica bacterium CG11_big_fil_rev_8_21_14_0_20_43_6]|nr:MAG: hypothetical protein COV73_01830 [Candidatus Omnitrophica bacterium CG11_big_fil_rev_8_21_14_0_20_43_6]
MDGEEIKRRSKRKDFLGDVKVRFVGQPDYTTLAVKDISASGIRVISPRLGEAGDSLEIKMNISGRDIQCKGKVIWVLLLRPCLGNIASFDMGLEFYELKAQDRVFLEKLTEG